MAVIMDIRRYILKRRTDAKSRRMLWHEVVETLHLSLCASFYLDRDDVSVDNCEVVNFATRSLVCILPIEHLGFDKTIMGFKQLQTGKHLRGRSLVNKVNIGSQKNVVGWQREHGLHQAQVEKEILDIFLEYLQDENNSILLSSHITTDLEKIADSVTFIDKGRILLTGSKDEMVENHALIKCKKSEYMDIEPKDIISARLTDFGAEVMISDRKDIASKYSGLTIDNTTLEEIMLFYVRRDKREWK